jgi:zinc protease
MKFRTAAGALAALAIAAPAHRAAAQQLPAARDVLERYVEAVGGRTAMLRHDNRRTVAEMSMPAAGLTMNMEILAARPDKMFTRVQIPMAGELTGGYDGTTAWQIHPMTGAQALTGTELRKTQRQADFDSQVNYRTWFTSMETVGRGEAGGRPCWQLKIATVDGQQLTNCYDVETGLLLSATGSEQGQQAVISYEDYKDFDGEKVPTRVVTSVGAQQLVLTVKSVTYEPIPAATFEVPAAVKAAAARTP